MMVEIKMPNLSQTTNKVKLLKWLVKIGGQVKKGDVICEVETDKVNMEVESFTDGYVIKLIGDPGQEIENGMVIAVLSDESETTDITPGLKESVSIKVPEPGAMERKKTVKVAPGAQQNKFRATKLVWRLAEKNNIELTEIKGTGPRGTIVKKDIKDYINRNQKVEVTNISYWKLTPNQQAVSANLSKSKSSIPHYYLKSEVLADNLLKKRNNTVGRKKLSMYSYFIFYSAKALQKFPRLNGYFKDDKIYRNGRVNTGFAVASGDELYVPVIKDADKKQLDEIDREVKLLAARAQERRLEPAEISGGTYTVSNLGIYPVDEFYGVINYPQAVLLGIGSIRKALKVNEDGSLVVKNIFNITGSFDHRIANGAQAGLFLTELKILLEEVK